MKETLFEKLYKSDLVASIANKNGRKIHPDSMRQILTVERRMMRSLALSNPIMAKIIDGASPHDLVEEQRRDKFSRWLGFGRWFPTGHDKEHETRQRYLEEIFTNIGHYQSRGLVALDNPVTLALYGAIMGFGLDAIPLAQHGLGVLMSGIRGSEAMPELSLYVSLFGTEIGFSAGTFLGYIRRTRKVDWFDLFQNFGNVGRTRVWDQADYIRYKVNQLGQTVDDIVESRASVYVVSSGASENEMKNAKKNSLFKELGISIDYEEDFLEIGR